MLRLTRQRCRAELKEYLVKNRLRINDLLLTGKYIPQAAGERVLKSLTRYLQEKLKLMVNAAKSAVDRPRKRKFPATA